MNQSVSLDHNGQTVSFPDAIYLPNRHLTGAGVMPEVYSWLFPPVREQIETFMQQYPMHRFLENIHPGLDNAHLGLFEAFITTHPEITGLDTYPNIYPLSGSSEGIFHIAAHCITEYSDLPLYALENEYRGYQEFAKSLGRELQLLTLEQMLTAPSGILFLSNPSARDGNCLSDDIFTKLVRCHKTVLDLAYVGLTKPFDLDLTDPNILAVLTSLSKPFGLYYYRVGMMWSREAIDSLYGDKWFKNLHGILLGETIINHFDGSIYEWAHTRQLKALKYLNDYWQTEFVACDVALLATAKFVPKHLEESLALFKRGDVYRICLTPLMMALEGDMPKMEVLN